MIKKSVFEEELIHGMQRELHSHNKKQGMNNLVKAADYLHSALEILEEAGFDTQADKVFQILKKIAEDRPNKPKDPTKVSDKHTSGLTSEKQVKNLIDHGTVFNMADDGADLLNAEFSDMPLEVNESDAEKTFEDSD